MTTYRPGEWVNVSSALARRWIEEGSAEAAKLEGMARLMQDAGVVVLGNARVAPAALKEYTDQLEVVASETPKLAFPRTLLWNPEIPLRLPLLAVGFGVLDRWQVAAALLGYEKEHLAAAFGSDEDREYTEEIVRDLRVPVYNPDFMFIRRSSDTQRLIDTWAEERDKGTDRYLALLRALYLTRPRLWPLPASWVSTGA